MAENSIRLGVVRLPRAEGLPLPAPASSGSAGLDLRAAIVDDVVLVPGQRTRIATGLVLQIPRGWEGQVRPRSGLAASYGVTLTNSPGTIDSDYRGEVQVLMINHGEESLTVRRGDRIAQLVLARVPVVEVVEVQAADETERGSGGFGSTGLD
jgi:dUTP pyrophosphatase